MKKVKAVFMDIYSIVQEPYLPMDGLTRWLYTPGINGAGITDRVSAAALITQINDFTASRLLPFPSADWKTLDNELEKILSGAVQNKPDITVDYLKNKLSPFHTLSLHTVLPRIIREFHEHGAVCVVMSRSILPGTTLVQLLSENSVLESFNGVIIPAECGLIPPNASSFSIYLSGLSNPEPEEILVIVPDGPAASVAAEQGYRTLITGWYGSGGKMALEEIPFHMGEWF